MRSRPPPEHYHGSIGLRCLVSAAVPLLGSELPIGLSVFSERFLDVQLGNLQFGSADSPTGLRVEVVDFGWEVSEIWDDKIESIRSITSGAEPMDIVRFI